MGNIETLKLVTSNELKLKEFQRFGLENITIEKGVDLKEVDADEETVIVYKAMDAGKNRIVEDTSLQVEGADVGVNVRWMIDNLQELEGRKATWKVLLGHNDGEYIHLYEDEVEGILVESTDVGGFGFDSIFKPNGTGYTLHQLSTMKNKDSYSARKKAVNKIKQQEVKKSFKVSDIPKWEGSYQHD